MTLVRPSLLLLSTYLPSKQFHQVLFIFRCLEHDFHWHLTPCLASHASVCRSSGQESPRRVFVRFIDMWLFLCAIGSCWLRIDMMSADACGLFFWTDEKVVHWPKTGIGYNNCCTSEHNWHELATRPRSLLFWASWRLHNWGAVETNGLADLTSAQYDLSS